MVVSDWRTWYDETIDALVSVIADSSVSWGETPEGEPYITVGDRTSAGITYPACFIPQFTKVREDTESDHKTELHDIQTLIWVIQEADIKKQEANLREAVRTGAQLENALYDSRTLSRTCSDVIVREMEPGAGVIDGQAVQTVSLTVSIIKTANIH